MAGNLMRFLREKLTRLPTGKGILTHCSLRSQLFFLIYLFFSFFLLFLPNFIDYYPATLSFCTPSPLFLRHICFIL